MAKRTFNEAERYVIKHWAASYELEQSMASAREKYQQMCERVVEDVIEAHREFYAPRLKVIHVSGNQPGSLCISKKAWPKSGKSACGYWLENIRLEFVSDEDAPPPLLSVWIKPLEERGEEVLERAKRRIAAEAADRLPKDLLARATKSFPDSGYAVAYEFVSKAEFLEILADADTARFPKLLTERLENLIQLTPVIDEVVGRGEPS